MKLLAWNPGLVLMRLRLMVETARKLDAITSAPSPSGHKCSLPPPPAGIDWEGKNGYGHSMPLRPVPPTDEELRLQTQTIGWLRSLSPTNRVIVWGCAADKSVRTISRHLKKNEAAGCQPLSHQAVHKRWLGLLCDLAEWWTEDGHAVDDLSRMALLRFDFDAWMRGPKKRTNKGRAFVNGVERRLGRIQAAEVDQESIKRVDMFFRRNEWRAEAPQIGRDGVIRNRKRAVDKGDRKAQ